MTRRLVDHVGLAKPYRFERVFAILFALLLAVLAGADLVHYWRVGELTEGAPRFWYFLSLAVLLGLAVLGARWPRFAMVVLSLAALELGLGVGSDVLDRYGYAHTNLLPENELAGATNLAPLLQAIVQPGAVHRLPAVRSTTTPLACGPNAHGRTSRQDRHRPVRWVDDRG